MAGKQQQQTTMTRQIPDLPFEIPADDAKITKGKGGETTITVAELQAQIKAMQDKFEADTKSLRDTNLALMQTTPVQTQQLLPTEVDLKDLPDPVSDPTGYAKAVADRTRQALENAARNQQVVATSQNLQTNRLNALWEDFSDKYADYAKNPGRVRYLAQEVAAKAEARGRDVQKYMYTPQFMADVVTLYDKEFGKPQGEDDGDGTDDGEGTVLDKDDLRTGGIPGGGPKTSKPPKNTEDEQGVSIMEGVRSWQQKTGFSI